MKLTKLVSIILLTYNERRQSIACLHSLDALTYPNYHILVVDNASQDGSWDVIEDYRNKHPKSPISHLRLKENYGYAGGNNRGIREALKRGAEYVLLLNPDTLVEKDFLENLVNVAERYSRKGLLGFFGSRIYLKLKTKNLKHIVYSNGGYLHPTLTKATLKDYGKNANELHERKSFATDYVTGTCLLISRRTIERVGLMREDYFLYYEDADWSLRASRMGVARIIVPSSVIYHEQGVSLKQFPSHSLYYHTRNALYFAWWNGTMAHKLFVIAFALAKLGKQPLKLFFPFKRSTIKPVTKAILDFFLGKTGPMNKVQSEKCKV